MNDFQLMDGPLPEPKEVPPPHFNNPDEEYLWEVVGHDLDRFNTAVQIMRERNEAHPLQALHA